MHMHRCMSTVFGYRARVVFKETLFLTSSPLLSNARYLPILCANVSGAGCESSSLILTVRKGHTLNAEP